MGEDLHDESKRIQDRVGVLVVLKLTKGRTMYNMVYNNKHAQLANKNPSLILWNNINIMVVRGTDL